MTSRFWQIFVAGIWLLIGAPAGVSAETTPIRIVTQSFAPLQWDNDGKPDGYVAQFIATVFERVKDKVPVEAAPVEFMPWKRAMLTARSVPNVLLFSLSRTQEREDQFLWLGEVSPYGQFFYQLKSNPEIAVDTVDELKGTGLRIGVQDGGNLHAYLRKTGLDASGQLMPITDYRQGIEMLYLGRIDLLPLTGFLAKASACRQGYDGALSAACRLHRKPGETALGGVQPRHGSRDCRGIPNRNGRAEGKRLSGRPDAHSPGELAKPGLWRIGPDLCRFPCECVANDCRGGKPSRWLCRSGLIDRE